MALVRSPALTTLCAVFLASGCTSGPGSPQARDENRKMDCLTRSAQELEREASRPILVARSQSAEVLPPVRLGTPTPIADLPAPAPPPDKPAPATDIRLPDTTPIVPASGSKPAPPPETPVTTAATAPQLEGDSQVRIVASIGNNPIYESEVREAVYQRMGELIRLSESQRTVREKEIFREELKKMIERELVIDDMNEALTDGKEEPAVAT